MYIASVVLAQVELCSLAMIAEHNSAEVYIFNQHINI